MADYNVNMKQWNGTSFDNVLPLAYNAKQLEGQSLAEVKQWVQDNNLLLYTGQYIGTGTYGENAAMTLTFPFEPLIIALPFNYKNMVDSNGAQSFVQVNAMPTDYNWEKWLMFTTMPTDKPCYAKKSADGKTINWYSNESASDQANVGGTTYYFAAIGGYDMGGN